MASLELKCLTKRFGPAAAVDRVSLKVDHGKLICLLGPSGCGKTTTLRLLAGFMDPTEGEILVGERVVSAPGRTLPPERRRMSMIFQSYALWPHMTVAENIAYGLTVRKAPRAEIAKKLAAVLAVTRLEPLADRYPGELSGGQQQRVSLARALIVEPETLLLDEPLSNLDANLREEMRFEIRRLHDEFRYTTVYVTHDQAEAMTTADLVAVMNAGRIEQVGTPEEVYDRPRSEFVARFMGASNVLRARAVDRQRVLVAGTPIRCEGTALAPGLEVPIAIRQHDIAVLGRQPAETADNLMPARVERNVFLGAVRSYVMALGDGTQLKVAAPPHEDHAVGSAVWLRMPAERCRVLAD